MDQDACPRGMRACANVTRFNKMYNYAILLSGRSSWDDKASIVLQETTENNVGGLSLYYVSPTLPRGRGSNDGPARLHDGRN